MSQVIIYTQTNGQVAVCYPTGEIPIEEVLIKDCPPGAIIVDESTLPQGADAQFFDAWVINGSTISVNFAKAQSDYLKKYNSMALKVAEKRQLNTLAGITNLPDDATWLAKLNADRDSIASATTTEQLITIALPTL
jgi:hypothetical protein